MSACRPRRRVAATAVVAGRRGGRSTDVELLRLASGSLGALVAEPLFLLVDAAVVGTLGTAALAGLGAAGAVLQSVVGLFVVLAYTTTAAVARAAGAGRVREGLALAVDGLWVAAGLGALLAAVGELAAPQLLDALGTPLAARAAALGYLRAALPGLPGMLLVLAATGALRGLRDVRTPLLVAGAGAALNALAVTVAVLGLGAGTAGSGAATAGVQTLMALALLVRLRSGLRQRGVRRRPSAPGVARALRANTALALRTASLRLALLLTTAAAAAQGSAALAAHQVVSSVWSLLALALDALAIAAQALVGGALGAGDAAGARALVRRSLRWSLVLGAVLGLALAVGAGALPHAFAADPGVRHAASAALLVAAAAQPLAAVVFVLDGVLIGAGDGRYLAAAGAVVLVAYAPLALVLRVAPVGGARGLVVLWVAFAGVFMAARALALGLRVRGSAWAVTGSVR